VVVIRIPNTFSATFSVGITATAANTSVSGYKFYTVTAGTGTVTFT
jgi:hypothetical protein